MNVCSIEWVGCILILATIFFLFPSLLARQCVFALASFSFVATQIPDTAALMTLVLFTLSGYAVAKILLAHPRLSILVAYLVLLILAFLILRQYVFIKFLLPQSVFQRVIATVGLSYILFRQIQVVVDSYQGQIERLTFWNYINYQLNLFGFVAGPIQRYQEFCGFWMKLTPILPNTETILRVYLRMFVGIFKIILLSSLFMGYYKEELFKLSHAEVLSAGRLILRPVHFLILFYSFPIYLYLNFSGYCDMVISGAALFGMRMPENFDHPFLSRNMIDFWTRWHRTLGFWIRDYIFTPLYKWTAGNWAGNAGSLAFICYFVAFFLAGIWHGSTWNFVIYGLLNGLGLAVTKLWENLLIKRIGRAGLRSYLQNRAIRIAAIFLTLNFACLTMFFFASSLEDSHVILKNLWIPKAKT